MRFAVALSLALALPAAAMAQGMHANVLDALPGRPGVTCLALLKQLAPDLAETGEGTAAGHLAAPLRYSSGGDESATAGHPVAIGDIAALPVRAEGRDGLALLVDLGEEDDRAESFTVLALVEDASTPAVLDAADVSDDLFTAFFDPPLLDLSPDDQAILVRNTHSNSNQAYETVAMLFVKDGKIEEIGRVFAFSDWWCGFERRQTVSFEIVPDAGQPFASIRVAVLYEGIATEPDCGETPDPFSQTVSVTYRWNGEEGRFVPDSDALEVLAEENERRF